MSVTLYRRPDTPRCVRSSLVTSPTFVRGSLRKTADSWARVRDVVDQW